MLAPHLPVVHYTPTSPGGGGERVWEAVKVLTEVALHLGLVLARDWVCIMTTATSFISTLRFVRPQAGQPSLSSS